MKEERREEKKEPPPVPPVHFRRTTYDLVRGFFSPQSTVSRRWTMLRRLARAEGCLCLFFPPTNDAIETRSVAA